MVTPQHIPAMGTALAAEDQAHLNFGVHMLPALLQPLPQTKTVGRHDQHQHCAALGDAVCHQQQLIDKLISLDFQEDHSRAERRTVGTQLPAAAEAQKDLPSAAEARCCPRPLELPDLESVFDMD